MRADLGALDHVIQILRPRRKYNVTDVTYGNQKRMAFGYDSRKVDFSGLAGEIVLAPEPVQKKQKQFARTPFACGFKAHRARFNICKVAHGPPIP